MQAVSGSQIGRFEKQFKGLNLQVGGGRLKLHRDISLLMSNAFQLKHVWEGGRDAETDRSCLYLILGWPQCNIPCYH